MRTREAERACDGLTQYLWERPGTALQPVAGGGYRRIRCTTGIDTTIRSWEGSAAGIQSGIRGVSGVTSEFVPFVSASLHFSRFKGLLLARSGSLP